LTVVLVLTTAVVMKSQIMTDRVLGKVIII